MEEFEQILRDIGNKILEKYKEKLSSNNVNATSTLSDTANFELLKDNSSYLLVFILEDYYYYIEEGRNPGKFPPVSLDENKKRTDDDIIIKWMKAKGITPEPYALDTGKKVTPTEDQLAFLIGRKIANEGIDAKPYIEEAVNEYAIELTIAVQNYLGEEVRVILNEINE